MSHSHKYLNDLGIRNKDLPWNWNKGDKRQQEWRQDRKKYGFDERDTWSLKYALATLVYERLKWYREHAPIEMDQTEDTIGLKLNTYQFEGKDIVFGTAIDRILTSFERHLKSDDHESSDDEYQEYQKCWALLGVIMPGLWW